MTFTPEEALAIAEVLNRAEMRRRIEDAKANRTVKQSLIVADEAWSDPVAVAPGEVQRKGHE